MSTPAPRPALARCTGHDLVHAVRAIHRETDDWIHGDLWERITGHATWELRWVPAATLVVDTCLDDESVAAYAALVTEPPPIVLDDLGCIVDGAHRVAAARRTGRRLLRAWTPVRGR